MTETRQGMAVTLISNWYEYAGGPADDVSGLTIEIIRLSDDTAVLGPTSSGIAHPATGVYTYSWTPANDAELGNYLAVWAADGGLQSTEIVAVGSAWTTSLATVTDLQEMLGRDLTDAEAAKAPRLLASASAKIRTFCRRTFTAVEDDELVLRPVGMELRLPNRPVTEVAQVEQIGTAGSVDRVMSVGEWAFDGIDRIELWPCPTAVSGVLPTATYADTYRVTYSHGTVTADQFIVDKTVEMTLRTLLAPTQVAGLVQERIGQYSYQYGQASGDQSPGASVRLTKDDERELRQAGYRRSAGTIQTRAA